MAQIYQDQVRRDGVDPEKLFRGKILQIGDPEPKLLDGLSSQVPQ